MKFEDLDREMRVYEESLDQFILPEMYMAARLTKEICRFEAPFDPLFCDLMVETTKALMGSGFRIIYGFTESDEISLLFHPEDNTFGRKVRKVNTTLAGEASAAFSLALGNTATFDCRVIPLPTVKRVEDYFAWRQEDAHRNSLNGWCYWTLRKEGMSQSAATAALEGKSVSYKNDLLFQRRINYNDLPSWQKRGIGIYYRDIEKEGINPLTGQATQTKRRELYVDRKLPVGEKYRQFVRSLLSSNI